MLSLNLQLHIRSALVAPMHTDFISLKYETIGVANWCTFSKHILYLLITTDGPIAQPVEILPSHSGITGLNTESIIFFFQMVKESLF